MLSSIEKEYLIGYWKRSRNYSSHVIDAMPNEKGEYKPSSEMMSFREQALHLLAAESWILKGIEQGEWEWNPIFTPENYVDMEAVRDVTRTTFLLHEDHLKRFAGWDKVIQTPFREEPIPCVEAFRMMLEHEAHHRGQMVIYLRMNGVTPPTYYQE
ncbi:DinB family protein [Marininema halotolerans]|uniref:Uncharacterized damage-inducible protein DinB (Forms a four-helix bundle) n=1 Tax=Marininema halotolerans TaxID=1155944 RepID=A0A1I6SWB5_9BACL|nr:DinB family protein [Marininema halotolerans]SFS81227.1 Uncharacterized damage-inducible protein DinB (forms a four-helix bundle) [Marininema halotolerans]